MPECPSEIVRVDPPVYGGGVEVLSDDTTAVAIDVETGKIVTIDTILGLYLTETFLDGESQPFRIAEGKGGNLYVTLRGSGELARFDRTTGEIGEIIPVCPAPRGVAVDEGGVVYVACAGGELVSVDGDAVASQYIAPDLRDVAIDGDGKIWVSTFRGARIISVSDGASFSLNERLVTDAEGVQRPYRPGVAWRMRARRGSGVDVLHRLAVDAPVDRIADGLQPPGPSCSSDVLFALSSVTRTGIDDGPVIDSALAVDFAQKPLGGWFVIEQAEWTWQGSGDCTEDRVERVWGHGIATDTLGRAVVLTRNPFQVAIGNVIAGNGDPISRDILRTTKASVCLPPGSTPSGPNSAFHALPGHDAPPCAACHPEGGDDGTIWDVVARGPLRTPSLRGLSGSEPLHWNGEFATLDALLATQVPNLVVDPAELRDWLDAMATDAATPNASEDRIEQGAQIAEEAGCLGCHGIDAPSVPGSFDVGTGGLFQVPRLRGVAMRLPILHDGCAKTLAQRFDPDCGGANHGNTADLSEDEISALVAWLGSL